MPIYSRSKSKRLHAKLVKEVHSAMPPGIHEGRRYAQSEVKLCIYTYVSDVALTEATIHLHAQYVHTCKVHMLIGSLNTMSSARLSCPQLNVCSTSSKSKYIVKAVL